MSNYQYRNSELMQTATEQVKEVMNRYNQKVFWKHYDLRIEGKYIGNHKSLLRYFLKNSGSLKINLAFRDKIILDCENISTRSIVRILVNNGVKVKSIIANERL